jgi:hypothetical protein
VKLDEILHKITYAVNLINPKLSVPSRPLHLPYKIHRFKLPFASILQRMKIKFSKMQELMKVLTSFFVLIALAHTTGKPRFAVRSKRTTKVTKRTTKFLLCVFLGNARQRTIVTHGIGSLPCVKDGARQNTGANDGRLKWRVRTFAVCLRIKRMARFTTRNPLIYDEIHMTFFNFVIDYTASMTNSQISSQIHSVGYEAHYDIVLIPS